MTLAQDKVQDITLALLQFVKVIPLSSSRSSQLTKSQTLVMDFIHIAETILFSNSLMMLRMTSIKWNQLSRLTR